MGTENPLHQFRALLHEGEGGRRPDEGAFGNRFPLTLALSLMERELNNILETWAKVHSFYWRDGTIKEMATQEHRVWIRAYMLFRRGENLSRSVVMDDNHI